jgi:haloalkane dehalogenase
MQDAFVRTLDLTQITVFGQDWGDLIGLRVLADYPERFARLIIANTFLPTGDLKPSEGFLWLQ